MNESRIAPPIPSPLPAADTIDLWWLDNDLGFDLQPIAQQTLAPAELLRAAQYKVEHARQSFLFFRLAMRACLASYAGIAPREVPLAVGEFGKPYWAQKVNGVQLEFNLSHSSTSGLLAVASSFDVGVDLEYTDPSVNYTAIVREVLSAAECKEFADLSADSQTAYLLRAWTCKEAFLKAKAIGLAVSLAEVTIKEATLGEWRIAWDDAREDDSAWRLKSWSPQPNYFAAVAYRDRGHGVAPVKFVSQAWRWSY